jgi:hypothetical protein
MFDGMSTLQEIEAAITTLNDTEFRVLREWITSRDNDKWDEKMDADAAAGRLDALAEKALIALDEGSCRDL